MNRAARRKLSTIERLAGEVRQVIELETPPPGLPGAPPFDARLEYDPVDLWHALAIVQRQILFGPPTDGGADVAEMAYRVVHDADPLDNPAARTAAEGLRLLALEWSKTGRVIAAEDAERLARIFLGEALP